MNYTKKKFFRPKLLNNRNLVASVNIIWVMDFTFVKTQLVGKPNEKIKILIVSDLGNGEIVSIKAFKFRL